MTDETLLYRQIHPSFVQHGRATSQAFRPTPKDAGLLSVYDGDLISSDKAWAHYTNVLGFASYGVMAVIVAECLGEGLQARPDPKPFPEHAVIDFSALAHGDLEKKSKRLKRFAERRGWQYRSEVQR
jgi:hypothetical protein